MRRRTSHQANDGIPKSSTGNQQSALPSGGVTSVFTYNISYAPDHTLQWSPPPNSKELAIALSYHFPLESDLESKMRAAMVKFLSAEGLPSISTRESRRYLTPEDDDDSPAVGGVPSLSNTSRSTARKSKPKSKPKDSGQLKVVAWGPANGPKGGFDKREVKRRRYQTEEGAKVAKNRGYACERHRRQKLKVSTQRCPTKIFINKLKCDPDTCASNKQRLLGPSLALPVVKTPESNVSDSALLTPGSEFTTSQTSPLSLPPLGSFHDNSFKPQDATEWNDYPPLSFSQDMNTHQSNFGSPWPSEPQSIGDHNWTLPLDISPSDTADTTMLDPTFAYDNTLGNSDILSFSWQGSSNLDPGIFFIPSAPSHEPSFAKNIFPGLTERSNLNGTMFPMDFSGCHSLVFPSDTMVMSNLNDELHVSLTASSASDEGSCGIPLSRKVISSYTIEPKPTPWYFCKTPETENGVAGTTITIGTGDDAYSTTFTDKDQFIARLKTLISHPQYCFSVPDMVEDQEQLTSFCRATYGKQKARGLKRLDELPYTMIRRLRVDNR